MKRIWSIVGLVVVVILAIFFLKEQRVQLDESGKLRVVTTFVPLYLFTVNVAGDDVEVGILLQSGVGPHDYAPSPEDIVKIAEADLVIKQGGIDDWVDELVAAAGRPDLEVLEAGEGILPHTGAPISSPDGARPPRSPRLSLKQPEANDPHRWLDPFLVVTEVERIRNSLMIADPKNSGAYARRAEEYILKLLNLDREIRGLLAPLSEREFVSFHSAFRYFAYEYELVELATIQEVPGAEPTPRELTRLADKVKAQNVRVIFSEPQFSPKIVESLSRDYGLQIVQLDPLETGELRPDYYEEVMRENARAIADALAPPSL